MKLSLKKRSVLLIKLGTISINTILALLSGRQITQLFKLKKSGFDFVNFDLDLVAQMVVDGNVDAISSLRRMGFDVWAIDITVIEQLLISNAPSDTVKRMQVPTHG